MPNHVHLLLVPSDETGLWRAMARINRAYALLLNRRQGWTGHFWQGPFRSYAIIDEAYLFHAVRYVELNPVAAGLVEHPALWPWSSARAHLSLADDPLTKVTPLLERWPFWREILASTLTEQEQSSVRAHFKKGLPAGSASTLASLADRLGRSLERRAPGRPSNGRSNEM